VLCGRRGSHIACEGRAGEDREGRAGGHILYQMNPEGEPWHSRHRGPAAQETQMARLRQGGVRTRANKAWTHSDASRRLTGTRCACGEAEEDIPHILLHCVRSTARRRMRDLRMRALLLSDSRTQARHHPDAPPPEPPDTSLASLLNCQAGTRTAIAVEAEVCACIKVTQGYSI
jgi:hypothetical protein